MAHLYFNRIKCLATQSKRIKVLYTIPNFDTAGSGKALLNIATRLDKSKFEPHILCMHDRGDFFKEVSESGIPVHLVDYTTPMKPYAKGLWRCWKISRSFKKINPDVIHSFHYAADYSEPLAARLAGIKWIYTKKNMSWGGSSRNAWQMRTALAHGIIAQNTDMIRQFFPRRKNIALIPRGVDEVRFSPGRRDEILRQKFGVSPAERLIICVANLVPVKGIEILIDAFGGLEHDFPEWKVWIVGDDSGEYGQKLKRLVQERGLSGKVIFTGKQMAVKVLLDQAEIFVLPTLQIGEGSPVALLEAMANGKVVVGSGVPGIKDQLQDFPDYIFQPANASALQLILKNNLLKSAEALVALGCAFRNTVEARYRIDTEVSAHALFYERVVTR